MKVTSNVRVGANYSAIVASLQAERRLEHPIGRTPAEEAQVVIKIKELRNTLLKEHVVQVNDRRLDVLFFLGISTPSYVFVEWSR